MERGLSEGINELPTGNIESFDTVVPENELEQISEPEAEVSELPTENVEPFDQEIKEKDLEAEPESELPELPEESLDMAA